MRPGRKCPVATHHSCRLWAIRAWYWNCSMGWSMLATSGSPAARVVRLEGPCGGRAADRTPRARTGRFLGSHVYTELVGTRKGIVYNGQLYVGVRVGFGAGSETSKEGQIWTWTGTLDNPFQFETAGCRPGSDQPLLRAHRSQHLASQLRDDEPGRRCLDEPGDTHRWARRGGHEQLEAALRVRAVPAGPVHVAPHRRWRDRRVERRPVLRQLQRQRHLRALRR